MKEYRRPVPGDTWTEVIDTLWAAIDDLNQGLNQLADLVAYALEVSAPSDRGSKYAANVIRDEWGK